MFIGPRATLTVIFALVAGACSAPPQERDAPSPASDSIIAVIDARVEEIERSLPSYRVFERHLLGLSAEGGRLLAFGPEDISSGDVRKLVATHLDKTGRTEQTFYYAANPVESLIYVVEERAYYDQPLSGSVRRRVSEAFHFSDGVLLRWRDTTGRIRRTGDAEGHLRAEDLRRESAQLHCGSGHAAPACGPSTVQPQ